MYIQEMYEDSLAHFGIKNQKWGVRRYQNLDRTWTEEGKKRYGKKAARDIERAERKKERKARRQAVKQIKKNSRNRRILTDEELEAAVRRLQNEKKLRELTEQEVKAGRLYTKEIMKEVGKKTLPVAISAGLLYGARAYAKQQKVDKIELTSDIYALYKSSMRKK